MRTLKPREERRQGGRGIPLPLEEHLSPKQIGVLRYLENFGWCVAFVRQRGGRPELTVLQKRNRPNHLAILREDGELVFNPHLTLRA